MNDFKLDRPLTWWDEWGALVNAGMGVLMLVVSWAHTARGNTGIAVALAIVAAWWWFVAGTRLIRSMLASRGIDLDKLMRSDLTEEKP